MLFLAITAAQVGLLHSIAPGHWLPIVMLAKVKKWNLRTAALGALAAASGHIILSVAIAVVASEVGLQILANHEELIEKYAGLLLTLWGTVYALLALKRHRSCHGHSHHPDESEIAQVGDKNHRGPFAFLFLLGFSPCVAVLPVFLAGMPFGGKGMAVIALGFSVGVITALLGSTLLVKIKFLKLDNEFLEHYGDVLTGAGLALMGLVLFFMGESHH